MQLGFIGTGLMGLPMAQRLLAAGNQITVYNRTTEKAKPLKENGAEIVESVSEVFQTNDLILVMLSDGPAVRQVLLEQVTPDLLKGKTIIQMSTIGPDESLAIAKTVQAAGAEYIEAPVLGSTPQANAGQLIVLVGGSQAQYDNYRELLSLFGPGPVYAGELGQASTMKLAVNQMIAGLAIAYAHSLAFAKHTGLDMETFIQVIRRGPLYSKVFDAKLERTLNRDFDEPQFPLKHLTKDVKLFAKTAPAGTMNTSVLEAVIQLLEQQIAAGAGDYDYSALYDGVDLT